MSKELGGHKIGFIGLGVMGKPMAQHLATAGAEVVIHNRSRGVVEELLAASGQFTAATSPAEVAQQIGDGVIMLMLTNTPAVDQVILGENGLLEAIHPGALVIDMSTTGLAKTRECAEKLGAKGCGYVDAPVSGGEVGAKGASLSIMAGGSPEDFERALPILNVLGGKVTHMGVVGAGQITKLANQIIVAQGITAIAEALTLAQAAGVEPSKVRDAIRGGFAESRLLAEHGERMVTGNFEPGGRASYQLKDVREALQVMEELGLDLPMLKQNVALWVEMVEDLGMANLDHSGILRLYEQNR